MRNICMYFYMVNDQRNDCQRSSRTRLQFSDYFPLTKSLRSILSSLMNRSRKSKHLLGQKISRWRDQRSWLKWPIQLSDRLVSSQFFKNWINIHMNMLHSKIIQFGFYKGDRFSISKWLLLLLQWTQWSTRRKHLEAQPTHWYSTFRCSLIRCPSISFLFLNSVLHLSHLCLNGG